MVLRLIRPASRALAPTGRNSYDAAMPSPAAARFRHRDIRLTVFVRSSPETVYEALTSAKELEAWWVHDAKTQPRNLGRVRLDWPPLGSPPKERAARLKAPRGSFLRSGRGVFVDLEPGRKVAWGWDRAGLSKGIPPLTSVFIEPAPGGSQVTLVHAGFPAARSADPAYGFCARLWGDCIARLRRHLSIRTLFRDHDRQFWVEEDEAGELWFLLAVYRGSVVIGVHFPLTRSETRAFRKKPKSIYQLYNRVSPDPDGFEKRRLRPAAARIMARSRRQRSCAPA